MQCVCTQNGECFDCNCVPTPVFLPIMTAAPSVANDVHFDNSIPSLSNCSPTLLIIVCAQPSGKSTLQRKMVRGSPSFTYLTRMDNFFSTLMSVDSSNLIE